MTDEDEQQNNENNDGSGGSDQFDPKALSSEAQEYIRRTIQSESDRKGAEAERRLQAKSEAERRAANKHKETQSFSVWLLKETSRG